MSWSHSDKTHGSASCRPPKPPWSCGRPSCPRPGHRALGLGTPSSKSVWTKGVFAQALVASGAGQGWSSLLRERGRLLGCPECARGGRAREGQRDDFGGGLLCAAGSIAPVCRHRVVHRVCLLWGGVREDGCSSTRSEKYHYHMLLLESSSLPPSLPPPSLSLTLSLSLSSTLSRPLSLPLTLPLSLPTPSPSLPLSGALYFSLLFCV